MESISCFILQVHLNHIDAVVQMRPSMSHVISGRAYNRQALQSREMNGGASGSKAPSRKVLHKFCLSDLVPFVDLIISRPANL